MKFDIAIPPLPSLCPGSSRDTCKNILSTVQALLNAAAMDRPANVEKKVSLILCNSRLSEKM